MKKPIALAASFLLTLLLLEAGSYLILAFHNYFQRQEKGLFIYEKTTADGSLRPDSQSVTPIRKSISIRWKSKEFDVAVNTNQRGMREPFEVEDREVDVAFFGDSYTFGHGVEWKERYTTVFAASPYFSGSTGVSFSYLNGFQPEHYEYFLRVRTELRPKHVILGLYLGNDLGADVRETRYDAVANTLAIPFECVLDNGAMAIHPRAYRFPLDRLFLKSQFATLLVKAFAKTPCRDHLFARGVAVVNQPNAVELETGATDLAQNRAMVSLVRIKKIVEDRGGRLTVLLIPQNYFFGAPNPHIRDGLKNHIQEIVQGPNILKSVKETCHQFGLTYYDPTAVLSRKDFFEIDGHWNAGGHGKIGNALADYIHASNTP